MIKGTLIVISGPSGSGKDSVLKELFKKMPELRFSISSVSRAMREGETEGEKYNFINREKFEDMIKNDMLLEYNVYCGNYYGTPIAPVNAAIAEGKEIILELDVNGFFNVKKKCEDLVSIFVMPPSFEVLKSRLEGRGTETPDVIAKRLEAAKAEIAKAPYYDYIIVNDKLETAVNDFCTIIKAERMRTKRQNKAF